MWIGVTLAVVMELVPQDLRTSSVAMYLFITSNIGGNLPLLVPPLQDYFMEEGWGRADALRGLCVCVSVGVSTM